MWNVLIAVRRVAARSEIHATRVIILRQNIANIPADTLSPLGDAATSLETLLPLAAALDDTPSVRLMVVT